VQSLRERPAIHDRHHEVQHYHVGTPALANRERVLAVLRGLDLIAIVLEGGREQLTDAGIVIDHKDTLLYTHRRAA